MDPPRALIYIAQDYWSRHRWADFYQSVKRWSICVRDFCEESQNLIGQTGFVGTEKQNAA